MAEKDAAVRLRRAVQENNLFLVKRLIKRVDLRNPDPNTKRFTSLAWAAVYGHKETFDYLLSEGHDDDELSKDSEDNTILILLADSQPPSTSSFRSGPNDDATLRMARSYYDRYPHIRNWANSQGKTALHAAATKGNEELVRMLIDLGADFDLPDNQGNTPLHYASAWGHVRIVQLLIERGCQFSARNNEGFTASDYAYSTSTRDTLQDAARAQFENNKRARRQVFAQAAARGVQWPAETESPPVNLHQRTHGGSETLRMRSGSGTSRTTGTSDSDFENGSLAPRTFSKSASSSPSHLSSQLPSGSSFSSQPYGSTSPTSAGALSLSSQSRTVSVSPKTGSTLSHIATRMLERDADAMEKYKLRNRSGSAGTTSTNATPQNGSSIFSGNDEEMASITSFVNGSVAPRRLLRPSASAAQLRSNTVNTVNPSPQDMIRSRSGTNPTVGRSPVDLPSSNSVTQNGSSTSRQIVIPASPVPEEDYSGPSELYAQFPPPRLPPPLPSKATEKKAASGMALTTSSRRLPFHLLSKPVPSVDTQIGHRRGASTTS